MKQVVMALLVVIVLLALVAPAAAQEGKFAKRFQELALLMGWISQANLPEDEWREDQRWFRRAYEEQRYFRRYR